jgi:transcriptional regulator of nitric oxide reductase
MSSTYSQLPGTMNLAFKRNGDFATLIDFDGTTLVDYTVTATVTSLVTGTAVVPFTTTITDASAGKVNIALTDTQTAALPAGTYGWQLDWTAPGSVQRTALSGTVEVYA